MHYYDHVISKISNSLTSLHKRHGILRIYFQTVLVLCTWKMCCLSELNIHMKLFRATIHATAPRQKAILSSPEKWSPNFTTVLLDYTISWVPFLDWIHIHKTYGIHKHWRPATHVKFCVFNLWWPERVSSWMRAHKNQWLLGFHQTSLISFSENVSKGSSDVSNLWLLYVLVRNFWCNLQIFQNNNRV